MKLITELGYTVEQVAEKLGCCKESVRRWKAAAMPKLDPERELARQKRRDLVEEPFGKSHKIYGYRKTFSVLRSRGVACSPNTILADYKERGIKSVVKKKYRIRTTDSNHSNPVAENVLKRTVFQEYGKAQRPNEKWVTDMTYVETTEGWLFVVAIIDLFSRKVIGDLPSRRIELPLVGITRCALLRWCW